MPAAARRTWVWAANCSHSDNWQYCRSLDKAIAPVCSFYGPAGLVLSLLQNQNAVYAVIASTVAALQGVCLTPLVVVLDGVSFLFAAGPPTRGTPTRKA